MRRTRFGIIAAFAAAGVAALAACSSLSAAPDAVKAALADFHFTSGTAKAHHVPANTGDFFHGPADSAKAMMWVQLTAGTAGNLSPVVINAAGFTLYRFDKDRSSPSVSNCTGACAVTWPPVEVSPGGRVFLDGVPKTEVGVVQRSDGTLQLTIGGWPVYRYSKDTAPGETNGEGVDGTWYAVSPIGTKVLPPGGIASPSPSPSASPTPSPSASPTPSPSASPTKTGGSSVALGNGNVTVDSGTNFSEPNGSEGVAGPGCQNIDVLAESLTVDGGPVELFSGANCTGQSVVVSQNIADLSTIGFGNNVQSILFGG